jgi:hypothetical protein
MSKEISKFVNLLGERGQAMLALWRDMHDIVEGRDRDIKGRHKLFTNPDTPETSTNLTGGEVSMIANLLFVSNAIPELSVAGLFAHDYCNASLSRDGFAVRTSVESYQLSETKLSKLNVITQGVKGAVSGDGE